VIDAIRPTLNRSQYAALLVGAPRQLPGNVHIPSGIATAPTLTKDSLRPTRVPSDIATVSTVSQGKELAS
jgi:hypothetical protein